MTALNRSRGSSGQEERKKNNTKVGTLCNTYGESFADGCRSDMKLGALKTAIGLDKDASLNDIRNELKK
jgi:hypothetical protein